MPPVAEVVSRSGHQMLSSARINAADMLVRESTFPLLVVHDLLPADAADGLAQDFPRYREAGFFPYDPAECGPAVNQLVSELTAPEFADAVGRHLGVPDLGRFPTLISISRLLNRSHGQIHTDSRSKVVTALIYLNPEWPATSAGCLRFLGRIDDMNSTLTPEIRPLYGTLAAFRRTDNSFHGHLPHEGERRVIQVAWVINEEEKLRKTRRGRFSRIAKWITGVVKPADRTAAAS